MIKKFFSILFLFTAFVISSISAKALTVTNQTNTTIEHVVIKYSEGSYGADKQICVRLLEPHQVGTSELDNLDSVNLKSVEYIKDGAKVSLDFSGDAKYLPLNLNLTDVTSGSVTYTDNVEARTKAEEAKLINQAAGVARTAKDAVSKTASNAWESVKGLVTTAGEKTSDAASTVKSKATEVTHKAAQTVADKTAEAPENQLVNNQQNADTKPQVDATQAATAVKDKAKQTAEDVKNTAKDAKEKGKEAVQDLTEQGTQLVHDAAQIIADKTDTSSTTTQSTAGQKTEEAADTAKEKANKAKHRTEETLNAGIHRAQEGAQHLVNRGKEVFEQVKDTVKEAV